MLSVSYLPLDTRPCNTVAPSLLAQIGNIHLKIADAPSNFLMDSEFSILSFDRWIYGGLVESRRPEMSVEQAREKLDVLVKKLYESKSIMYGFNVLLRQAPSAFNESEAKLAEKIKEASIVSGQEKQFKEIVSSLPQGVWESYIATRNRNFTINQESIALVKANLLKLLVIGLDDLSAEGFNQTERRIIDRILVNEDLKARVHVLPGTDEMGMLLVARLLIDYYQLHPRIFTIISHPNPDKFKLRYEDRSLTDVVKGQLKFLGAKQAPTAGESDLVLFVHSPQEDQEDLPLEMTPKVSERWLKQLKRCISKDQHCILADLRYANGADSHLMQEVVSEIDPHQLAGFSAWNTTANALGMALSQGVVKWISSSQGTFDATAQEAHKTLLNLRILEDWFYQAEIRPVVLAKLRKEGKSLWQLAPDVETEVAKEVTLRLEQLSEKYLNMKAELQVRFPWKRLFDIDIQIANVHQLLS